MRHESNTEAAVTPRGNFQIQLNMINTVPDFHFNSTLFTLQM